MSSLALTQSMEKNYAGIFAHGAFSIVLGVISLFLPTEYLGVVWIATGLAEGLFALTARGPGQLSYHLLFGALFVLGGYHGLAEVRSVAPLFCLTGGVTLINCLRHRYPGWRAFTFNGGWALACGVLLLMHPSLNWLGLGVAIELIIRGVAWVGVAWRGLHAFVVRRTMARPLGQRTQTA